MTSPLPALRIRNFRLFFIGQVVSNVGTWFQSIAQTLLVLELTGSGKALGILSAVQFTPMLLLVMHGGIVADRVAPRRLMIATAAIAALIATALAVVTELHVVSTYWVWGLALAMGCVQAFDRPTSQAFLYEMVGPDDLPKAIGLYTMTHSVARMLGPALGGAAYAAFGSTVCFGINAVSFLFVIGSLLMMRPSQLWPRKPQHHEGGAQVRQGLRYAWQRPELRTPLLANVLIGCLAFNFMLLISAMARLVFHADAKSLGMAHALNAVGAVLASLVLARVARPSIWHLTASCFAMALTIALNALAPSLMFFLLWAPIFGFSVAAYQITLQASVQRATQPAMMGRVASLLTLGTEGTTPLGGLIMGVVIDAWSPRAGMAIGAMSCAIGGGMLLLSQRRLRNAAA